MENNIVIGIDIGGSHITSACILQEESKILTGTKFSGKVAHMLNKDAILKEWATIVNRSILSAESNGKVKLAFAMPGPFDYQNGVAMFEKNKKYKSLYQVSIKEELLKHLITSNVEMRFLNDATAFGLGVTENQTAKNNNKAIVLTLGTGLGACFLSNHIPQTTGKGIPKEGVLWDKPFKDTIADDYFSTRWFTTRYFEQTGKKVRGVKEIISNSKESTVPVFTEFAHNLSQFLEPYLIDFEPDKLILGGNISKANTHFISTLEALFKEKKLSVSVEISNLFEDAALIGASKLFDTTFCKSINYQHSCE